MPNTTEPRMYNNIQISLLNKNHTKWTREIAEHLFCEFEDEFVTLSDHKDADSLFEHYATDIAGNTQQLPLALVMHNDDEWIGVAIMDHEDMGMKPELGPWLTFFYVQPQHRGQGYARILLEAVNDTASKFTDSLYLWCFNQKLVDFYNRTSGFKLYEKVLKHGNRDNLFVLVRNFK